MTSEVIYQPTDLVLAKVKGFPAWPALIIPVEIIPDNVLKDKFKGPHGSKAKQIDQDKVDENEDDSLENDEDEVSEEIDDNNSDKFIIYSDMLKFRKNDVIKSHYCVKFLCDDSYIWVKPSDIQPLSVEECKGWLKTANKKKVNKKLIPAYEMASKGSNGIDIWDFVEYGSYGKPDEEEYVEDDYEDEETNTKTRKRSSRKAEAPTRTSARQSEKRKREEEKMPKRSTRATRSKRTKVKELADDQLSEIEAEEEENSFIEEEKITTQKTTSRKGKAKSKGKPSTKATKSITTIPKIEKYQYEDDVDWNVVGLGPQDLSLKSHTNRLVNKLAQKKNQETHSETKLDIMDKLTGVNKLIVDLLIPDPNNLDKGSSDIKEDYEVVLDELELALQYNGSNDEFITIFQSNSELLINFRIMINLKYSLLKEWNILDGFQSLFSEIYQSELIPDESKWSIKAIEEPEKNSNEEKQSE
ncbi:hypothetical protein Kpol_1073p25 [Vanderwaltozyma polyspora DSM 70294]|uniref:PWWP domain-containing protein n=1 Tax=Vanderwaltozyma polyspora (strain ATCC 22028 / DSM 70294 / BCRC 21397 / CBS 2163 / NBRC 10782 / NRRL Y-8283 / UCD 57-17) TaxID=436907 RepID=A7TPT6_VANPO|nr:uncharacterized protein Kpol_1073p25 [Vanderwaltozyma polyspora DSM 70294]EDO15737.1 hypothetical protein Kpol_1073p25 [Vanderwaltozyma polyspora DSM 70294]